MILPGKKHGILNRTTGMAFGKSESSPNLFDKPQLRNIIFRRGIAGTIRKYEILKKMNSETKYRQGNKLLIIMCAILLLLAMLSENSSRLFRMAGNIDQNCESQCLPVSTSFIKIESCQKGISFIESWLFTKNDSFDRSSVNKLLSKTIVTILLSLLSLFSIILLSILSEPENQAQKVTIRYIHNSDGMR